MSRFITKGQLKELGRLHYLGKPVFAALTHFLFEETGLWHAQRATVTYDGFQLLQRLLSLESNVNPLGESLQELFGRIEAGEFCLNSIRAGSREYYGMELWRRGFGHEIGLNKWADYLATIPKRPSAQDNPNPRVFDWFVLVDPRIDIRVHFNSVTHVSLSTTEIVDCCETPDMPYYIWVYSAKNPDNRDTAPLPEERPLTLHEGLWAYMDAYEFGENNPLFCAGSRSVEDPGLVPVYNWCDGGHLHFCRHDEQSDGAGHVTGIVAK